jgi:hypothetical protein
LPAGAPTLASTSPSNAPSKTCTAPLSRCFDPRKRFKFRQSQRGLLAVESHQGHAQRTILGGGDAA